MRVYSVLSERGVNEAAYWGRAALGIDLDLELSDEQLTGTGVRRQC